MRGRNAFIITDELEQMDSKEQMSIKCQSLSDRLRLAIGLDEDNPPQFLERTDELDAVIDAICCTLESEAKERAIKLNVSDSVIVNCLFYRVYHETPNEILEKEYKRATIVCILQFLRWCKDELRHGKLERRWLYDFDFDVKVANVLGGKYSVGKGWRAKTNNTLFQYADICALLTGKFMPQPLTRDMLALFGVRQVLEAKFRRIIGLCGIDPMPKIPHGTIPKILKAHEKGIKYKFDKSLPLDSIMHIYDWTDYSIHTMSSSYVWLVWKAVFAVKFLFCSGEMENESYFHINGSIEISCHVLERMREEFRKWVCINTREPSHDKSGQTVLYWCEPEIPVVNDIGQLVKIKNTKERVSEHLRVRQIKDPCVFVLIKEWPINRLGDTLRQNIRALHDLGVRFTIFVNSPKNAGVGALQQPDIPWKMIESGSGADDDVRQLENYCKDQEVSLIVDLGISSRTASIIRRASEFALGYAIEYVRDCIMLTGSQNDKTEEVKQFYKHLCDMANNRPNLERGIEA